MLRVHFSAAHHGYFSLDAWFGTATEGQPTYGPSPTGAAVKS